MPDDAETLLELAKRAAVEAGKKVMEIYQSGDFESYSKNDNSPVTSADYAANEVIVNILGNASVQLPIMSEEQNNGALAERSEWHRYWLIDPIDGTKEFIVKSGHFAVNVALVENNEPVIGVIYWPVTDTLYYASKNAGAFKLANNTTQAIHVRQMDDPLTDDIVVAISREQPQEWVMSRMNGERRYTTLALGSCSLKSCLVAEGKADIFLRIGETGEWDTGAPQCIVSEAGGNISSVGFKPLTYNKRDSLINPDFVVTGDQRVNWENIVR